MTSTPSPSGQQVRAFSYDDFQGLNTTRDDSSLDTGTRQALVKIDNGYCNFAGIIHRDRSLSRRKTTDPNRLITHVAFYGSDLIGWAQQDGGGTTLCAEPNSTKAIEIFPKNSVVSSTVFNNSLIFFCQDQIPQIFDGHLFKANSNLVEKPAFGVAIQGRLAIAGQSGRKSIVDLSRANTTEFFTRDENPGETSVIRAGDIDIKNIIGTSDEITGLGVFENSKLAVFTKDQTLIYNISPDISKWSIDDKVSIGVGTECHNSIANVGTDVIFCSRSGVHSLRRSEQNGITIYATPLSANIEELYKKLYRRVKDKRLISAFYDPDHGQYHVFFPESETVSTRLTMSISPSSDVPNKWSVSTYLAPWCGSSLGGKTVFGTNGGVFIADDYEEPDSEYIPTMEFTTPILWHNSITEKKHAREFILQASGNGRIEIECYTNEGKKFHTIVVDLDEIGDDDRTFLPLSKQYNRPFVFEYKGVQFKFKVLPKGNGRVKIIGFAVIVEGKEDKRRSQ